VKNHAPVEQLLDRGGHAAVIGGRTDDDGVGGLEILEGGCLDPLQGDPGDEAGHLAGMTGTRVVNNQDLDHAHVLTGDWSRGP